MEKTQTKLEPWRDGIVTMLKEARTDEQSKLRKSSEASESEVLFELAKERGGDVLIKTIDECRRKIQTSSDELQELGFDYGRNGDLEMRWDAPLKLRAAFQKARETPSVDQKSLKKYDLAILKVFTAETPADAEKVAESVIG